MIPTRDRAAYLDVALRSIAPQAAAAGAELVVVDDGPDPRTQAVAAAPRRALPAPRRSARPQRGAQHGDRGDRRRAAVLRRRRRRGPRRLARRAVGARAARLADDAGVLTGPIHARIEDHRFRMCGREGPPITTLDLRPDRPRRRAARLGREHDRPPRRDRARRPVRRAPRAVRRRAGVAGALARAGRAHRATWPPPRWTIAAPATTRGCAR